MDREQWITQEWFQNYWLWQKNMTPECRNKVYKTLNPSEVKYRSSQFAKQPTFFFLTGSELPIFFTEFLSHMTYVLLLRQIFAHLSSKSKPNRREKNKSKDLFLICWQFKILINVLCVYMIIFLLIRFTSGWAFANQLIKECL